MKENHFEKIENARPINLTRLHPARSPYIDRRHRKAGIVPTHLIVSGELRHQIDGNGMIVRGGVEIFMKSLESLSGMLAH